MNMNKQYRSDEHSVTPSAAAGPLSAKLNPGGFLAEIIERRKSVFTCPVCGCKYTGDICPSCGAERGSW